MTIESCDDRIPPALARYAAVLDLDTTALQVTTDRPTFARWIGRGRVSAAIGGAYCFVGHRGRHAILINLERLDLGRPYAIDVVVAEELVHMRDQIDGDTRRHAHHGYDRIAHRVSALTGVPLAGIRAALLPVQRRPFRYRYACPACGFQVMRRRAGTWSCSRCAPAFDRRYLMRIVERL